MLRLAILVLFTTTQNVFAQSPKDIPLPESTNFAKIVREASPKEILVRPYVRPNGSFYVIAVLDGIPVQTHPSANLPHIAEDKGRWIAFFSVVPRISPEDISTIRNYLTSEGVKSGKVATVDYQALDVPNLIGEKQAYKLLRSSLIPSRQAERDIVENFIANLGRSLQRIGISEETREFMRYQMLGQKK